MDREGSIDPAAGRRIFLVTASALAFVVVECVVVVMLVRRIGVQLPVGWQVVNFVLSLVPAIAAGFLIRWGVEAYLGKGKSYLRQITSPGVAGRSLLLFSALVLQMVFYSSLKVMVPLLNPRSFDGVFWEIDGWLLFGLSPNVFFVNLFSSSWLLRFVDFGYGYFFFTAVLISFPLVFSLRDERLRASFIVANVLLWSCGAWIYLAFPSVGPAYRFHEVWDAVRAQIPVSTYWQKQLLDNYQMVLGIARGRIDPNLSLVEGIGAFPSLHVGFQALFALYLGRLSRVARAIAWFLVFLTFLGSILTGWHYMVDSVAGLLLAWGIYAVMERAVLPPSRAERGSSE